MSGTETSAATLRDAAPCTVGEMLWAGMEASAETERTRVASPRAIASFGGGVVWAGMETSAETLRNAVSSTRGKEERDGMETSAETLGSAVLPA